MPRSSFPDTTTAHTSQTSLPSDFVARFAFVDVPHISSLQPQRRPPGPTHHRRPLRFPSQYKAVRPRRTASTSNKLPTSYQSSRPLTSQASSASSPSPQSTPDFSAAKAKRKKPRRLYDDPSPALTAYPSSAFPPITDHLVPTDPSRRLDLLICGLNPGLRSSQSGTHFAHPSNHFYKTLFNSGLTPIRVAPSDCAELVDQASPLLSIGLTNICTRPTAEGGELGRRDYQIGTPLLARKIRDVAKPRVTVFTGKGIGGEWERCCREAGALSVKRKRGTGKEQVKMEIIDVKSTVQDCGEWIQLPFPATVPWAIEDALGLGLMPFVIRHQIPATCEPRDFRPDEESGENIAPLPFPRSKLHRVAPPSSERHRDFSFCFLTTSPSGRVTTMGIEEKSRWMSKCKECVEYLVVMDGQDGQAQQRVKVEGEAEGGGDAMVKIMRRFEVINCARFTDDPSV